MEKSTFRIFRSTLLAFVAIALLTRCGSGAGNKTAHEAVANDSLKLITVGGTVSEIVCELGNCDNVIATDKTSTRPKHLQELPSVGYKNSIKPEGLLSLNSDIILVEKGYIGEEVVTQLESTQFPVYQFIHEHSVASTKRLITDIGRVIGRDDNARELVKAIDADLDSLDRLLEKTSTKPAVLFVYARGEGALSICGLGSFAEPLIQMAGAKFPITELYDFKPLTPEALVAANPDYVLFFETGLESLGGIEGALKIQGIMQTTAGQKGQIIAMDGLWASGFGPGVGKAAIHLAHLVHPELSPAAITSN